MSNSGGVINAATLPVTVVKVNPSGTAADVPKDNGNGTYTWGASTGPGAFRTVTGTTTLTAADSAVAFDASAGAIAQPLPSAVGFVGLLFLVATSAGPNLTTLTTTGAQTIGTYASGALTIGTPASGAPFSAVSLMSDGTNWQIV